MSLGEVTIARALETAATRLQEAANVYRFAPNAVSMDLMMTAAQDMGTMLRKLDESGFWASVVPPSTPEWPKVVAWIEPDGSSHIIRDE